MYITGTGWFPCSKGWLRFMATTRDLGLSSSSPFGRGGCLVGPSGWKWLSCSTCFSKFLACGGRWGNRAVWTVGILGGFWGLEELSLKDSKGGIFGGLRRREGHLGLPGSVAFERPNVLRCRKYQLKVLGSTENLQNVKNLARYKSSKC